MRTLIVAFLVLLLGACHTYTAFEGTLYGEALQLEEITPIEKILSEPDAYVGERVQVEGTVTEVCENMGCWMDIEADGEGEIIKVKVEDGVIVFPVTARGKRARVEGVVEKVTPDDVSDEMEHHAEKHAEEHAERHDSADETEPATTYRIKGIGAVVAD